MKGEEIGANPPEDRDSGYDPAFSGVRKSVEDLRTALRTGDVTAIKAAIKTLKQPLFPHVPELWIGNCRNKMQCCLPNGYLLYRREH